MHQSWARKQDQHGSNDERNETQSSPGGGRRACKPLEDALNESIGVHQGTILKRGRITENQHSAVAVAGFGDQAHISEELA